MAQEIRHDEIGANPNETRPLPLIDSKTFRLRSCDANGDAANLFHVLDLNVPVAKAEKLVAFALGGCNHPLNENLLGKALVVVESAVDAAIEKRRDTEQPRFLSHVDFVRSARQVHLESALPQTLEQAARSGHVILLRGNAFFAQFSQPVGDFVIETRQIHVFIFERIQRIATASPDLVGELNHLVHRLLPRKPPDEVFHDGAQVFFLLACLAVEKQLNHHRDHHVHPAGSDQGNRTVKVKKGDPGVSGRSTRAKLFDHLCYFGMVRLRFALLVIAASVARGADISGLVIDSTNGERLGRVHVQLSGTSHEAITGPDGEFNCKNVPPGDYTLQVSTVGYRPLKQRFTLEDTGQRFEVQLQPDTLRHRETVQVDAGPFAREEPRAVSLAGNELKNLASVITDDPLRAVQSMPGVTSNDDFQAQISLRGAGFQRIGLYLDGVLLHSPFHALQGDATSASVTLFNGDLLDSVNLHAAAPPVRFPDRTAGVLDFRTREGDRKRFSGRASASASNASMLVEGPFGRNERGSWLIAARKSYLQYIINLISDEPALAFGFSDVEGKVSYDLGAKHNVTTLVVDGRSGLDRAGVRQPGLNTILESDSHFTAMQAAWRYTPRSSFLITNRIAHLRERFENRNRDGLTLAANRGFEEWIGQSDATVVWGSHGTLDFGGTIRRQRDDGFFNRLLGNPVITQRIEEFRGGGYRAGTYAQQSWRASRAQFAVGLRWDRHSINRIATISPYGSIGLQLGPSLRLNFAWGQYAQFPDISQFFATTGRITLRPERATHLTASLEQRLGERTRLRIEAYNRDDRDLLFQPLFDPRVADGQIVIPPAKAPIENSQRGYARGVQIFLQRRTANGFTGWISYSYGKARVRDGVTQVSFPADYDQRHGVTLFGGYRIRPTVNVSAKWLYGSGLPIRGFFQRVQETIYLSADRNRLRLPDYKRLDLRINKAFIKDRWQMTLFAEVINALGRDNYRFDDFSSYDPRTGVARVRLEKMFPVLPSAGILFEF